MGKVTVLDGTTKNPITKIGKMAGICTNADTSDDALNYKRGIDCIKSYHGRAWEFVKIELLLEDYSAKVLREYYTHIGGSPSRLQESTRYVDYSKYRTIVPASILGVPQAIEIWDEQMSSTKNAMRKLSELGIPREDISMILPMCMSSKMVDSRNVRNLIEMSRTRTCYRAYWEFRDLFFEIVSALNEVSEEWRLLLSMTIYPRCIELHGCPERRTCGFYERMMAKKESEENT